MNAVILKSKPVGETVLQGEGAGPGPTSSALLSDLLSILRGNIKYPFALPFKKRKKIKSYNKNNYINSLYMRFEVKDKPGVLSQITNRLAKYKISVKRIIDSFVAETKSELWDSEKELTDYFSNEENYKKLVSCEMGGNVVYKHLAWILSEKSQILIDNTCQMAKDFINSKDLNSFQEIVYVDQDNRTMFDRRKNDWIKNNA